MGRDHVTGAERTRKIWENPWVPAGSWLKTQDVRALSRAGGGSQRAGLQGQGEREGKGAGKWDGAREERGRGWVGPEEGARAGS